jgi:hypothetical protein
MASITHCCCSAAAAAVAEGNRSGSITGSCDCNAALCSVCRRCCVSCKHFLQAELGSIRSIFLQACLAS